MKRIKRKRAGIDYDESSVDFIGERGGFLYFYNQRHGTNFKKNDINFYEMERVLGISEKQILVELNLFYQDPLFLTIKPLDFAVEGLMALKKTYSPVMITSRPEQTKDTTLMNVSFNFPDLYEEIHFIHRYEKISKCLELEISLLIEDDPLIAELAASKGIEVFLLDRAWNRNVIENSLIKRMGDYEENPNCGWKEIIQELNRRNGKQ